MSNQGLAHLLQNLLRRPPYKLQAFKAGMSYARLMTCVMTCLMTCGFIMICVITCESKMKISHLNIITIHKIIMTCDPIPH